jgi:LacI family transcriptional regulator
VSRLAERRPSARTRLLDVAAAAGVSKSVASRALAGAPDIAEATKARVRAVALDLGYHASVRARRLTQRAGGLAHAALVTLNVTPEVLGASFLGPTLAGILSGAAHQGLELQHVVLQADADGAAEALSRLVAEDRADGLILLTFLPLLPADLVPLERAGVPYVLVNRHFGDVPVNCVVFDWERAASDAALRLGAAGHRQMALLLPVAENSSLTGRADGWRAGVEQLGFDPREAPILRYAASPGVPEESLVEGQAVANRLLRDGLPHSGRRPTAIVGFNDWCALGVLRAADALDVDVPGQLSVIGFDSTRIGIGTTPPLCSYSPHFVELGRQAAGLLASVMRVDGLARQRITVPIDFECRGSCGPAPGSDGLSNADAPERV